MPTFKSHISTSFYPREDIIDSDIVAFLGDYPPTNKTLGRLLKMFFPHILRMCILPSETHIVFLIVGFNVIKRFDLSDL